MLRTGAKVKKSKTGHVFKEVKDYYLRKEIPCGVIGCQTCHSFPNIERLDLNNTSLSSIYETPHILIPTTELLIQEIDFFEHQRITNVIILESVMNTAKNRNIGVYKRIQNIESIPEKCFYIFNNEHHQDIFTAQKATETHESWQGELFRKSVQWYTAHVSSSFPDVAVVALSTANSNTAVEFCSLLDYVQSLVFVDDVIDILSSKPSFDSPDYKIIESSTCYPDHLDLNVVNLGLKINKFYSGIFMQKSDDYTSGSVRVLNSNEIYYIRGVTCINRAFNDDLVVIEPIEEIIDESQNINIDEGCDLNIPENSQFVDSKDDDNKYCRVVHVLRRNWRQYSGHIIKSISNNKIFLFKAFDARYPLIMFQSNNPSILNKIICVSADDWFKNYRYPHGHLVKILGDIGDKNVETSSILFDFRIPYQNFSQTVLNCLPKIKPNHNMPENWDVETILRQDPSRRDLRQLNIYSIDPPGCTDIDDALHIRPVQRSTSVIYEVGIHIADVTYYVQPSTAIDQEAYRRGTTVYLVDKRIDMLPDVLSSNLCSLKPNVDRLAFSVLVYLDVDGNFVEDYPVTYTRSVICSKRALTYAEAQVLLDDQGDNSEVSKSIKVLYSIMMKIRAKRMSRGALTLDSREVRFEADSETQDPLQLELKTTLETNKLVEECMLLANVLVATRIYQSFPHLAVLRRHPKPNSHDLTNLYNLVSCKFSVKDMFSCDDLSSFLQKVQEKLGLEAKNIVSLMCIRCLQQATYICSGSFNQEAYYHFGLAEPIYTHFTSPIRRYPDIIVHRLLLASIQDSDSMITKFYNINSIHQMCSHLNRRHTSAQLAARQSIKLHFFHFLKTNDRHKLIQKGSIVKIHQNSFSLYIPAFHFECFCRYDSTQDPYSDTEIDVTSATIRSKSSNVSVGTFSSVVVQLSLKSNCFDNNSIKITLVEPKLHGFM